MSSQILAFAAAGASIPLSRNRNAAERIAIAVGTAIAVYLLTSQEEAAPPPKRRAPWRPKATPAGFPGGAQGGQVVSCITAEGEPCDLQPGGGGEGEGEGGLGGEGEGEGGLGGEGEGEGEGQGEGEGEGQGQGEGEGEGQGEGEGEGQGQGGENEVCNLGAYTTAKHDAWRTAALNLWANRTNPNYTTGAASPWDRYQGPEDFETWWRWAISATAAAAGVPVPSQVCVIPDDWEGAYLEIASILSGSEDELEEA